MSKNGEKSVTLVAVSGLSWPTRSRGYLINLVKDVVAKHKANFAIIAGHTVDGKYLEVEFKERLKERIAREREVPREEGVRFDAEWVKEEFESEFIEEYSSQLSDFLPKLPNGANWHIAIAERIYDRPIGAKILEELRDKRADVRIIGKRQEDGFYDREPKFPVQLPGFEEIRVIVPHRSPWFSKVITNLVQRLMSAFAPRTLSPKPDLILVGVTGTAAHLPYYDGVPTISVPALNKLVEQQATEHMIGATVIRVIADGNEQPRIVNGVHNFRTAAFEEKAFAVSTSLPSVQQAVMHSLIPSDASFKAVLYRVNAEKRRFHRKTDFKEETVKNALMELVKVKKVVFSKQSNRYGINEELRRNAKITLDSLWDGSRQVKHVVWSCLHGGALKSLYFTALEDLPKLAADADAVIENGDLMQGIAHNYMHNGELLPFATGVDKQEVFNAYFRAAILVEIFRNRVKTLSGNDRRNAEKVLAECLIPYVYNRGNHDMWVYFNRCSLPLQLFDTTLHAQMIDGVNRVCDEFDVRPTFAQVKSAVDASIRTVGESRMIELNGIAVGIKHPHKGRTIQKSARIQEVAEFVWRRFTTYLGTVATKSSSITIAYVANYHEAAATHITKFGQTILGVMTGAYMYETDFETHHDKVVDPGPAVVNVRIDKEGRLLYSETEYVGHISEEDRSFVTADHLTSKLVFERSAKLLDRIGLTLPWR